MKKNLAVGLGVWKSLHCLVTKIIALSLLFFSIVSLVQYRVVVPKLGTVVDLCNALSKLSGIATEHVSI